MKTCIYPISKEKIIGIIYGEQAPGHKIYEIDNKTFDLRNAIDIFAPEGTSVYAIDNGIVIKICKNVQKNYQNIYNPKKRSFRGRGWKLCSNKT